MPAWPISPLLHGRKSLSPWRGRWKRVRAASMALWPDRSRTRRLWRFFRDLAGAEAGHEATLLTLYQEVTNDRLVAKIPDTLFSGIVPGEVMEGGMRVEQALEWTTGKGISDILDLSMALESYSYDLYLKMERTLTDGNARRVFLVLAGEEAKHLESMAALIEERRSPGAP